MALEIILKFEFTYKSAVLLARAAPAIYVHIIISVAGWLDAIQQSI